MCTGGVAPSALNVLPIGRPMCTGPAANIADVAPMVNVPPFGMCNMPSNPAVAAATAAALGVSTPSAAAVAAATVGLAGELHMPKGMMLVMGMWSMMLASGTSPVMTLLVGSTTSELGATPKVHCIKAPMQTCNGIVLLLSSQH